jgi:hypothetical protein
VHITTKVVSSNPVQSEVYSIQHYGIKLIENPGPTLRRLLLVKLKSSLRKFYGRHHDDELVNRYGTSLFVLFMLAIVLSVLRFTNSGIFKLFFALFICQVDA